MNPQAVLLGRSEIDIDNFLVAAKQALGFSISLPQGRDKYDAPSFLTMLSRMKDSTADMQGTLEDPGHLLRHINYIFLAACDPTTRIDLIQRTPLAVQFAPTDKGMDILVISGDLEEWRTAIINCCSNQSPFQTRLLFDQILLLFEGEGLGRLWSQYQKKTMSDQTFQLLER